MRRTNKIDVDFQAVTRLAANGLTQRETAKEIYLCYNTFKDRPEIRAAWRKGHDTYLAAKEAAAEAKHKQFKTISEIAKEARAAGLTYGQFVAGGNTNVF